MKILYVQDYSTWKEIVQNKGFATFHKIVGAGARSVWAGWPDLIYHTDVEPGAEWTDWNTLFEGDSTVVPSEDDALAYITGLGKSPLDGKKTMDGVQRVSVEPAEGDRPNFITSNWCDKRTWYYSSNKATKTLTPISGTVFRDPDGDIWVDNYHGLYSNEDTLTNKDGEIPRLVVRVNGVAATEQDPEVGSGGDYVVEYNAQNGAEVTFFADQTGNTIEVDCWVVGSSEWIIKPSPGKKLKIDSVETQFSLDISVRDTVTFQIYGFVDVFAPQLMPGVPSGTKIPLGAPVVYKTMHDYINESNGTLPIIQKTTSPSPGWRDLACDIQTFPWNYEAVISLSSAAGMEIRIKLKNDTPFSGSSATATFYCLSYSE